MSLTTRNDLSSSIKKSFVNIEKWMKLFNIHKRDYQTKAMRWCLAKEQGFHANFDNDGNIKGEILKTKKTGLVADEMGLGKTIVMLGTWVGNFKRNTLIVLPSALLDQWAKLVKKFMGLTDSQLLVYHGNKSKIPIEKVKEYYIVLTTYGMVSTRKSRNKAHPWRSPLWDIKWDRLILDEAHHAKHTK